MRHKSSLFRDLQLPWVQPHAARAQQCPAEELLLESAGKRDNAARLWDPAGKGRAEGRDL